MPKSANFMVPSFLNKKLEGYDIVWPYFDISMHNSGFVHGFEDEHHLHNNLFGDLLLVGDILDLGEYFLETACLAQLQDHINMLRISMSFYEANKPLGIDLTEFA